jgi:prohibitin 2
MYPQENVKNTFALVLFVFGGFFLLMLTLSSYHIVPPGHRGILVRLGKVNPEQLPEGLTIKAPLLDRIIDIPIMQLKADGKAECFSSDLQNLDVNYSVLYRVPQEKVVTLFREYKGDPYMSLVEPRIQEQIKQVTAMYRAEDLVKNREKFKEDLVSRTQHSLAGLLNIVDVSITNISLSDQLEQAIEAKVVREQEALGKQFELEKEKKQAEITVVRANAEAQAVKIKGDALKTSPEVIQLEIAQRWDGKAPLSVAVGQGGAQILLPLNR